MLFPDHLYSIQQANEGRKPLSGQSRGASRARTPSSENNSIRTVTERGKSDKDGKKNAVKRQPAVTRGQQSSAARKANNAVSDRGNEYRRPVPPKKMLPGEPAVRYDALPAPHTDRYGNVYKVNHPKKFMPGRPFRIPQYTVGTYVNHVPLSAVSLVFGDIRYFFCEGVFFRPVGATFQVCRPPVGMTVNYLPTYMVVASMKVPVERWNPGAARWERYVQKEKVYYHDGVFYVKESARNRYRVIPPLKGTWVTYLPPDRISLMVGGELFFRVDDTYYLHKRVSGEDWFIVVGDRPEYSVYADF